jgi:hypothetical protein
MDLELRWSERDRRRESSLERLGWVALSLLVLAGLSGAAGKGPLSWTTAAGAGGLVTVEYQRVTHHQADDSLTMTLQPGAVEDGVVRVRLTGSWTSGVDRQSLTPQPAVERLVPGGSELEFPVSGTGPTTVHVAFRAQDYGSLSGQVAVRGDRVTITQYVLP